jgi:hypothetical protein
MKRGDIAAVLFLVALLGALLVAAMEFPNYTLSSVTNWGFGPGWKCTNPGRGEPICIKQTDPKSAK